MAVHHHPTPSAQDLAAWRVAKKIKPSQRGAIKLARLHGKELLCVRYRENPDGTQRITTIELVVERVPIQKRKDPVVSFKIKPEEFDLRRTVQAMGGKHDGKTDMWRLRRSEVIRMGLRRRIAVTIDQVQREQVHP